MIINSQIKIIKGPFENANKHSFDIGLLFVVKYFFTFNVFFLVQYKLSFSNLKVVFLFAQVKD